MDIHETAELVRVRSLAQRGTARRIRLKAGLSHAEIASPVGVTPATICRWELGERRPRGAAALRYLELLDALSGAKSSV